MRDIIAIVRKMDQNNAARAADVLFKIALDLSQIQHYQKNDIGGGAFGIYYSDFNPLQLKELENKLGRVPEDLGIKQFHGVERVSVEDIVSENISCAVLGPIIAKYTSLRVPGLLLTQNLSHAIFHRQLFTNKMPGRCMADLKKEIPSLTRIGEQYLIYAYTLLISHIIQQTIIDVGHQLKTVGIQWYDNSIYNFHISDAQYTYILNSIREMTQNDDLVLKNTPDLQSSINHYFDQHYQKDFSIDAALFDFGLMECISGSVAGAAIEEFSKKLEPYIKKNRLINRIYNVAQAMILE